MNDTDNAPQTPLQWFALSAPHCKELDAQAHLERYQIETFIPMHYEAIPNRQGKKERRFVPAIHNLLFARTDKDTLQSVKTGIPFIQYRVQPVDGRNVPIIVPDRQMNQFIAVCNTRNEDLIYLQPDEINLTQGTPVRIIGGQFDGIEGLFVKLKGKRNKRVVVLISGIAAVTLAEVNPDLIEIIK